MKVKVRRVVPIMYAHPALQAEFEKLFQENKDLRVSEGHLRDDVAAMQHRIDALIASNDEKTALIDELNDQIDANESDVAFWKKAADENSEIASDALQDAADWEASADESASCVVELQATINRLEAQIVDMGKQNDKLRADLAWWKGIAAEVSATNVTLTDEHDKYMDTITELEDVKTNLQLRIDSLSTENEELTAELVKHNLDHYKHLAEEWQETADQLADRVSALRDERDATQRQLRELQAAFDDLQLEHAELGEDYDALVKTKCDYAEEIDRLRKVVVDLQTNRFSLDEIFAKIMMFAEGYERIVPSTDK